VIHGLRIDVTSEELIRHLDERVRHHRDRASECEARAKRAEALHSEPDDDEDGSLVGCWPGYAHELERRATRHRDREALLVFFRNHVIAHEIYRLAEADLKSLELLPIELGAASFE
jgi:hypothetical protein